VASAALSVTIDTTAPVAPSIASFSTESGVGGEHSSNVNTLTLTGAPEANSGGKVYDGATLLGSVTADGTGAWNYTTVALANGAHSLSATATDAAGNAGVASAALSVTIDTTAPIAPSIASFSTDSGVVGDHITSDNTLTLAGTAEANSTVKVFDGATLLGSATANGAGAWSYTTAALADGAHSLSATATDTAGNTGAASAALGITVDATAPTVAQTTASPSTAIELPGDTITLTLQLSEVVTVTGVPTLTLNDGGTASYVGGSGTNTLTFTYTVGAGDSTVSALAITAVNVLSGASVADVAGNIADLSSALIAFPNLQIDPPVAPVAPVAPTIASFSDDSGVVGDHITSDSTLTLSGTAEANSTVKLYDGTTLLGSVTVDGTGAWNYTTAALANGVHSLTATATDAAGNTGAASAALSVTIDTTAPVAPTITSFSDDSGVVGDHITSDNTLTLTGVAEANSTVKVFDGATLLGSATANGAGVWSYTTTALTDGAHNLTAAATDAAGNTGATSAALSVAIDTTAPVAPSIASFSTDSGVVGDGITNDNTLTLSGTAEANSTVKIFDGATLLGSVKASVAGAWAYTTAALANGVHSLTATASDVAGNTGVASGALSVTIDTTAPVAPSIASFSTDSGVVGDHITSDNTLTLTGTAEANSTIKLYDGTTLLGSATVDDTGAWNYTTAALANGIHSLTARATDVAGNTGVASAALSVTIDTTAPVAPSIASFSTDSGVVGDHITSDNTLTLTGTAEANSTVKVYDGATLLGSATANTSGAWSLTTAALTDGAYNLTATATDVAGNTSATTSALSLSATAPGLNVTIDTTAPVAPSIASFSTDSGVVGDNITNDNTLTLSGTAEANSTVKIFDGATLLGSVKASVAGAWAYTTAALANGAHSLTATATDVAGNAGVASDALAIRIDTIAPIAPTIASFSDDSGVVGDHITSDNTLTLTGVAEANSTVKVFDGATLLGSVSADGTGAWNYTTAALTDGIHSVTATSTDAAGNVGAASAAQSVTVDTTAPIAPTIASFSPDTGAIGDGVTFVTDLILNGTAEANSTVKIYDGVTLLGDATANGSGMWSYSTGTLASDLHHFIATATDVAGNTSAVSSTLDVTVETSEVLDPISVTNFGTQRGSGGFSGTAEANSAISIYDGHTGTLLGQGTASSTGTWSLNVKTPNDVIVTAIDQAGNTGFTHILSGTTHNDTITTTAANEVLFGKGGTDTFVLSGGFGHTTIADFQAANDVVQLSHNAFASFADVLAHAAQVGSDVAITVDPADSVTLHNTTLAQLTANNFHLV
jgi:hypothetical protein